MKLGAHWNLNFIFFKCFEIFLFFWVFSSHSFLKRKSMVSAQALPSWNMGQIITRTIVHIVWGLSHASLRTLLLDLTLHLCHTWRHVPRWLAPYIMRQGKSWLNYQVKPMEDAFCASLAFQGRQCKKDGICPQCAPEPCLKPEGSMTLPFWSHKSFLGEEGS